MREEDPFFVAWKDAVKFLGPCYFGPGSPETASNLFDLEPKIDKIFKALGWMSSSEIVFAACCVSFYDVSAGAKLSKKIGLPISLYSLVQRLDQQRRTIIAELIINANLGWHL